MGGIAQTLQTVAGQRYRVSFAMAGNPESGLPVKKMGVSAAGQSANFSFDTTGYTVSNMGWQNKTWTFTANSTATNLEFYSLSNEPANSSYGATLDNVSVVALPPEVAIDLNWKGISENSPDKFVYTFTRTGAALTAPLTVNFAVSGAATLGVNYTVVGGASSFTNTNGTVTFAPGSATAQITIAPKNDNLFTPNKDLSIQITPGSSYNTGTLIGRVATIINSNATRSPIPTASDDIITGTNRLEVIYGGLGKDILIGGGGADVFDYQNPNEGGDSIKDFRTFNDLISVRGSSFDPGLIRGTISPDRFIKGIGANTPDQRFIYNALTGSLLFDKDGNGTNAPVTLATLSNGLNFTYENILVS
ncbi:MAG: hypothetical protein N5P05_001026 [Chroococcopsis gigantea SAG 12.99]|nr:hypothetical protein [Chroococcopsis gigantea SAG 12.99]